MPISKHVADIVQEAIKRKLYVAHGVTPLGGTAYWYAHSIDGDTIVLVYGDGGDIKRDQDVLRLDEDKWVKIAGACGEYLYRCIGIWDFTRDRSQEADDIELATRSPAVAGRELFKLRSEVALLRKIHELYKKLESARV